MSEPDVSLRAQFAEMLAEAQKGRSIAGPLIPDELDNLLTTIIHMAPEVPSSYVTAAWDMYDAAEAAGDVLPMLY